MRSPVDTPVRPAGQDPGGAPAGGGESIHPSRWQGHSDQVTHVGPQFPDLFQKALQGSHLADNVTVANFADDASAGSFSSSRPEAPRGTLLRSARPPDHRAGGSGERVTDPRAGGRPDSDRAAVGPTLGCRRLHRPSGSGRLRRIQQFTPPVEALGHGLGREPEGLLGHRVGDRPLGRVVVRKPTGTGAARLDQVGRGTPRNPTA